MTEYRWPEAMARIRGNENNPDLEGRATFTSTENGGVLVTVEVFGLPVTSDFLGMHIHEFGNCELPFDKTGNHYNPNALEHPMHAGDLPSLLNNEGYAYLVCYTERFRMEDILGKSFIIHKNRDDFTTQPAGNAGEKIACGVIHA